MAEAGFDYVPVLPPVPRFIESQYSGIEFAENFGYGILTAFEDATPTEAKQRFDNVYAELASSVRFTGDGLLVFDKVALAEGIAEEIRTATQDAICEAPLAAERQTIRDRITEQFWQRNPALLAEFRSVGGSR